jgi:amidase
MTDLDLHYATLLEVADAIKARKFSPVELTRSLLKRVEKLEPQLHSYARVTPELALSQAAQAEQEIMNGKYRGPLHGVSIAVKDICYTAGITTAAGTAIHAHYVPKFDATVVKRLADAGAVLLGKFQLTEGAFAKHHPNVVVPRNP